MTADQPCERCAFVPTPDGKCLCRPAHQLSRELPGADAALPLPLCWDADAARRFGSDYDPEDWFTSWDHGAIDSTALVFATAPEHVTCQDCKEWAHA